MNDEQTTTQSPQEPPTEPQPGRGRLTRKRSTGMLAGVASGLGEHFNVDPVIFRIAFGVSVFFGGFGLLAYVALALFLPDESGEPLVKSSRWGLVAAIVLIGFFLVPAIGWGFWDGGGGHWFGLWLIVPLAIAVGAYAILKDRGGPGSAGGVLAAVFIAGAAVCGFILVALCGAAITAFGYGEIAAALIVLAGIALLVGAFAGGLRWLIVPALALALGVGVAAAADIDIDGSVGDREYTPLSADEIPTDGYEIGVGQLDVDLRELKWAPNQVVDLNVDVGLGQGRIVVPESVCVEADLSGKAGALLVAGEQQEGFDVDLEQDADPAATPRLEVTGDVQVGEIRVMNDDDLVLDEHGRDHVEEDERQAMREARAAACTG